MDPIPNTKSESAPSESGLGSEAQACSESGQASEPRAPLSGEQRSSGSGTVVSGTHGAGGRKKTVSIPMRLISECAGRIVCVSTVDGSVYKGKLVTYDEETMSTSLENVVLTQNDGEILKQEAIFIRGNNVRFVMLPRAVEEHPLLNLFEKLALQAKTQRIDSSRRESGRDGGDRKEGFGAGGGFSSRTNRSDFGDRRSSFGSKRDQQLRSAFGVERREDRGQLYVAGGGLRGCRRGGSAGDRSFGSERKSDHGGYHRSSYGEHDRR